MDKFTYERDFDNELKMQNMDTREPKKIVFNIPNDLNIYEYRLMCIRLAKAMGYSDDNTLDAFGPVDTPFYTDEDIEIRKHIFDLIHDERKIDKFILGLENNENDNKK